MPWAGRPGCAMTTDDLRARKQELLARRRQLEQDGGDKLDLALVREELLDVNAQLRALTHGRRKRGKDTSSLAAQDRKQYDAWVSQEDIEEAVQSREQLRTAAADSLEKLTKLQRETLTLYAAGLSVSKIAQQLGVCVSTASRNLSRAKKNAAESIHLREDGRKLIDGSGIVDLMERETLSAVVRVMTPKQLLYFYLYYSESLSMREINALIGVDHSSISRTIQRAMNHIDRLFGGESVVLEHPEALDELAYYAYCELERHPEQVPEAVLTLVRRKRLHPPEYYRKYYKRTVIAKPSVMVRRVDGKTPGKLLLVLQERAKAGMVGLFQWLKLVFSGLKQTVRQIKDRNPGKKV